jgi:ABC-2 type transport system ATP-binding protein
VLGLDPVRDHRELSTRCGVALQSGGAWSGVRAAELLHYVARLYRNPLPVAGLMDRLGLHSAGRTPYRRLSGGQQQRLAVATALVGRPELVVLDEPTAGLDPAARHVVWELVAELRAGGVTVVLCTHLMEEAEQLADLVAVVDKGRIVVADTPARLTGVGAENTVRFLGPPGMAALDLLTALPDGATFVENAPGAYVLTAPVTPHVLATLTAWCAAHGVLPRELAVERASLEDVFLELTGRRIR